MRRALAWSATLAIGLATPCAAGPVEDVAAATKAWTEHVVPRSPPRAIQLHQRLRDGKWLTVDHHPSSVPAAPRQ